DRVNLTATDHEVGRDYSVRLGESLPHLTRLQQRRVDSARGKWRAIPPGNRSGWHGVRGQLGVLAPREKRVNDHLPRSDWAFTIRIVPRRASDVVLSRCLPC